LYYKEGDFVPAADNAIHGGLSDSEAQQRLQEYGPNTVPEDRPHPFLSLLRKFWGPVPWMLELSLVLELVLGKTTDTIITLALLWVNAILSFAQESRAQNALNLLRQRLIIQARALRDGHWQLLSARELVPGDVVHLRAGDVIPADLGIQDGLISVDQSALTGESEPIDIGVKGTAYAGSVVTRGEATGEVTLTGSRTYFGKTAELVHIAKTASHLETIIMGIVKYLVAMDITLVIAIVVYAWVKNLPFSEVLPFSLILLVASVPVALPATFTLATALGSLDLSKRGALVTRLSAVEEAAAMDVLCSDKTGTITKNELTLAGTHVYPPHSEDDLLQFAALASASATQDPIDLAILAAARRQGILDVEPEYVQFVPFDPLTKRTEVIVRRGHQTLHVIKGTPDVVASITTDSIDLDADVERLADQGYRVLAVAAGPSDGSLHLVGLIGLQDPPREDSRTVIQQLRDLGVRVLMITGDNPATAHAVAAQVGIAGPTCLAETLRQGLSAEAVKCEVFAGVFPQDKFDLVRALQQSGHVVGMTGDGVNDAPALKQAEVGVAVTNATDVAKAAASIVLTEPGLSAMLSTVEVGRRIYQRMLTYTLNKITKTFQIALFLSLGMLLTGIFVTRPRMVLLLLFANDFVTMALATDRVSYSRRPDRWNVRTLVASALVLAFAWLVFSFGVLLVGLNTFRLDIEHLQTLIFVMLVFTGQANVYLVRERRHLWNSLPSQWLALSTLADVVIVSLLATRGILVPAIKPMLVLGLLMAVAVYMFVLDFLKIFTFKYFDLH
jgi:H+-transporting ATPase